MENNSEAGIAKQLKALVRECTDGKNILSTPKEERLKCNGDKDREQLAVGLVNLLLNTNYFNEITKIYISDFYMSKVDAYKEMSELGIDIPQATANSRIRADLLKFSHDFGKTVIIDIFEAYGASISKYEHKLNEIMAADSGEKSELDSIFRPLMLPFGVPNTGKNVTDEDIESLVEILLPYTEEFMASVERQVNKETIFYARELLRRGPIGEVERQRYNKLKALVNNEIKVL